MKNGKEMVQKKKLNILLTLFLFCVIINLFFMPKTPYQIDLSENINSIPISSNPNINSKENNLKEKEKQKTINENNNEEEEEIVYNKYKDYPIFDEDNNENIINTNKDDSKINNNKSENEIIKPNSNRRIFFPNFEKLSIFCIFGIIFYLMYSNYQKNELNRNKNEKKKNKNDGYALIDSDEYYENI